MKRTSALFKGLALLLPLWWASSASAQYCSASATCDEALNNVTIGSINNSTSCSGGYADHTGLSTSVVPGQSYPITAYTNLYYGGDAVEAWVDWNHDFVFDNGTEMYSFVYNGGNTFSSSISVPGGATAGGATLRVRMRYFGSPTACGSLSYGEAEDYTLNVVVPTCAIPTNIATNNITATSADVSWDCSGCTGPYYVEYGPAGFVPGTNASPGGGTVVGPIAGTSTSLSGLPSSSNLAVYVRQDCSGDFSPNGGPALFSTPCASATCNYVFRLTDNYGDGWNNATCNVLVNGNVVVTLGPQLFGCGPVDVTYAVCPGATLAFQWTSNGIYFGEANLAIFNSFGIELYSFRGESQYANCDNSIFPVTSNGTPAVGSTFYTTTGDCTPPACIPPTALVASNVTAHEADLSWSCSGCSGPYYVEYGPPGFTPGTDANPGTGTVVGPIAGTSTTLTGLTSQTAYSFRVRQDCGGNGFSLNSSAGSFSTGIDCADAIVIDCSESVSHSFNGAGVWNALDACFWNTPGEEQLYKFTAALAGDYLVNVTATNYWAYHTYSFKDATGSCDETGWTCIGVTYYPTTFTFNIATPGDYYLLVNSTSTSGPSDQTFNITCAATCPLPLFQNVTNITHNSASVNATCNACTGTYEVEYGPTGFTPGTGLIATSATLPVNITGLSPLTTYDYYLRQDCGGGDQSFWTAVSSFTTAPAPPECGDSYYDHAGPFANYGNGRNDITTICPDTPGELVTVTFTSFSTESNWDPLYVWDGPDMTYPMIASPNGPPFFSIYGAGGWWGGTAPSNGTPGVVTSSDISGCLTFAFTSDGSVTLAGWEASVTCDPPPPCGAPTSLTAFAAATTAQASWNCPFCTGTFNVEYGPAGFTPGTGTVLTGVTSPATLTGLTSNTSYEFYVVQDCGGGLTSTAGPEAFATGPACGDPFYDSGGPSFNYVNMENDVTTLCPDLPGSTVIVNFTSFSTESGWDPIYVFNGPTTASPKIVGPAGAPFGNNVYGTGGYWGTTIPGPFISTDASGCLTFAFTSDGSVTMAGWTADITCAPPSACTVPSGVTASNVSGATADISWACAGCVGPYIVEYGISGFTPGTDANPGVGGTVVTAASSPITLTGLTPGTIYKAYVRQDCDGTNTTFSNNSYGPATFTTGPGCGSTYYDSGGAGGNYQNNENRVNVICPTTPGEIVILSFTSFNTESGWDPVYIFDGPNTSAPMVASANGAPFGNNVYGTGGWWGSSIPGPFISSDPSGCLTVAFTSDGSVTLSGWEATVGCAVPNYSCEAAVPIACLDSKFGFTIGGTNTLPAGACAYNGAASNSGVSWFSYTADVDADIAFSTCGSAGFDSRISVFNTPDDCDNLACVGASDDVTGCNNGSSEVVVKALTGETYYIAVHGSGTTNGTFYLNTVCNPVCAPGSTNDRCVNAASLTAYLADGSASSYTDDNTCSYVDAPATCNGTVGAVGNWYTFTTGANSIHRLYLEGNSENAAYTATTLGYAIYSGSCTAMGNDNEAICVSSGNGYSDLELSSNSTYYMLVYNEGGVGQEGSYAVTVDHPGMNDAGITAVNSPVGTVCDQRFNPNVTLKNFGEATLTSVLIVVSIDAVPVMSYPWTGSLAYNQSVSIELPQVNSPAGAHVLTVSVSAPNGSPDEISANSASSSNYNATGQTVKVVMNTDSKGFESSWAIFDAFFIPVATSPALPNSSTTVTEICLSTDLGNCWSFYVFDSFGDGMCCGFGSGSWRLTNSLNDVILSDNGQFSSQSPTNPPASAAYALGHEFCLPLGPSYTELSECGIYNNLLNNKVYAHTVPGATTYQFEFTDPNAGFRRRIAVSRNWVRFVEMQTNPLQFGVTYFCRVRVDQGAAGFSDDFFGAGCDMALSPSQPICTELIPTPGPTFSCGVTRAFGGSDKVWAIPVLGATQYRFNFSNVGEGYNRNIIRPSYTCLLSWVTNPLVNGSTYNVKVEAYVNNTWGGYCGAICQVTISNPPVNGGVQNGLPAVEDAAAGLNVWPNPVRDGLVTMRLGGLNETNNLVNVDVYDAFGKRVMAETYGVDGSGIL